jgi:hypothetical protein
MVLHRSLPSPLLPSSHSQAQPSLVQTLMLSLTITWNKLLCFSSGSWDPLEYPIMLNLCDGLQTNMYMNMQIRKSSTKLWAWGRSHFPFKFTALCTL